MTGRSRERGAALLIGLLLLLLVSVLATAGVRLSVSSVRGAVNEQLRSDAFQRAQNLVDGALAQAANTTLRSRPGERNCLPGDSAAECAQHALRLDPAPRTEDVAGGAIRVRIARLDPELTAPPRGTGYSAVRFQAGQLEVEAQYDQVAQGWGRAAVREGVAVIVPGTN